MSDDLSEVRFRSGEMRGLLVRSAPTGYLEAYVRLVPSGPTTPAVRTELERRRIEAIERVDDLRRQEERDNRFRERHQARPAGGPHPPGEERL